MEIGIGQGMALRRQWMFVVWVPFAILAAANLHELPNREAGDYAQYMLHAEALAQGRPYGEIGYIFTPFNALIGPRVQPPGWPLLLAPGVAAFGSNLLFPKVLVVLFALAFLWVAAVRLGKEDAHWIAIASAAATGVALEASLATNSPISDLPFAALVWGVILLADSDRPLSWWRVVAIGLLGTFVMTVRVVGVSVVPALFLLALVRPRDRSRLLTLVAVWVVVAVIAIAAVGIGEVPFLKLAMRGPEVLLGRVMRVWDKYHYALFEALTYPAPWNRVNDVFHAIALLILPFGAWEFVRRFWRSALGCWVAVYLGLLAVSPVADLRYLWPLTPVIAYMLFAGTRRLVGLIPSLRKRSTPLVAGFAAVLMAAATSTALGKPAKPSLLSSSDVQDLFAWTRRSGASQEMRMLFEAPRVLTLEAGVPAMGYFRATPEQALHELTRARITHLVVSLSVPPDPHAETLRSLPGDNPQAFEEVYRNSGFVVYLVQLGSLGT